MNSLKEAKRIMADLEVPESREVDLVRSLALISIAETLESINYTLLEIRQGGNLLNG